MYTHLGISSILIVFKATGCLRLSWGVHLEKGKCSRNSSLRHCIHRGWGDDEELAEETERAASETEQK